MSTLSEIIHSIDNVPLRKACLEINASPHSPFGMWPASLSRHHAYAGGLLAHTIEVCQIADKMLRGPVRFHNRDVVIAACLWHDIKKTEEYVLRHPGEVEPGRRTIPAIGGLVWTKSSKIPDGEHPHIQSSADCFVHCASKYCVDIEVSQHVEDCILSHHGRIEWGAIHEPKSAEAFIVHQADMLSAQYGKSK